VVPESSECSSWREGSSLAVAVSRGRRSWDGCCWSGFGSLGVLALLDLPSAKHSASDAVRNQDVGHDAPDDQFEPHRFHARVAPAKAHPAGFSLSASMSKWFPRGLCVISWSPLRGTPSTDPASGAMGAQVRPDAPYALKGRASRYTEAQAGARRYTDKSKNRPTGRESDDAGRYASGPVRLASERTDGSVIRVPRGARLRVDVSGCSDQSTVRCVRSKGAGAA
jgi:hypothetical protein